MALAPEKWANHCLSLALMIYPGIVPRKAKRRALDSTGLITLPLGGFIGAGMTGTGNHIEEGAGKSDAAQ